MNVRTTLVTGGTRGIGGAVAIHLAKKGYKVISTYHSNHEKAEEFSKEHNIPVYPFDVKDFDACSHAIQHMTQNHGDIEVLVHNAGITKDSFFHKMTQTMWDDVISTNLSSCFNVVSPIIHSMRDKEFGRIICISSVNGQKGQIGQTNYCAAKAGVIGFVKALSMENANKGITVNAVCPGYTDTEMVRSLHKSVLDKIIGLIPMQRLGESDEVARLVAFLVDDASSYITGSEFSINGGLF